MYWSHDYIDLMQNVQSQKSKVQEKQSMCYARQSSLINPQNRTIDKS